MTEATERIEELRPRRFRQYPKYRDSGVGWLADIPVHWSVKPVKASLIRNDSGVWGQDFDDDGTIVLRSTEQTMHGTWNIEDPARRRLSTREATYARLRGGDLLVTKSSGSEHHIGKTSIVDEQIAALNCCFSNFMQRLRVSAEQVPQFFWYFMNCPVAREQLVFLSSTTTGLGNLNGSILGAIRIPMPPAAEQRAIADFLDRETAKIDALVANKNRLIQLLQEKRAALISCAVTRGLDPNVPMKDSGVEWLGEIPAHWNVSRLRATVAGCQNGVWGEEPDDVHDVICVRVADFDRVRFRVKLDDPTKRSVDPRTAQIHRLEEENLLLEKSGGGDKQPVGAVVMYDHSEPAVCSNFVARVPVADGHHPRYLIYLHAALYAGRVNVRSIKQSTGIQNLDSKSYLNESVGLPSGSEQRTIADFLDRETTKNDLLIARIRQALDRLNEFRTALISAAVTGKIDVRTIQTPTAATGETS